MRQPIDASRRPVSGLRTERPVGAGATLMKADSMKTAVGLWIDHTKAVIETIAGNTESMRQITSHMEQHVRYSAPAQQDSAEDQRDRRFTGHLNKYYDEVVACIRDADSILILGPGEAKIELSARLENEGLRGRIVGIETVDKMTDRQVAARVRRRFLKSRRRLPNRRTRTESGA